MRRTLFSTMLAMVAISHAPDSSANSSPSLTVPNMSLTALPPPTQGDRVVQIVQQGGSSAIPPLTATSVQELMVPGGSARRIAQSCIPWVPKGALVDSNQDVWIGSNKIQHISPCTESEPLSTPGSSGWIVSAQQRADYYYYTEVYVQFYVPSVPSPSGRNAVFLWPGIEDFSGGTYLFQPVLQYNQRGVLNWQMQDYVVLNGNILSTDHPQNVNTGDQINAVIMFDFQNPGPSCSAGGHYGSNCNYWIAWWDVTNGKSGGFEYNAPLPLAWAQGAVLETQAPDPNSCQDFPSDSGAVFWGMQLYVWDPNSGFPGSSLPEVPNFTLAQYPNASSGWLRNAAGQTINCGSSGFQIGQGCWFNNCNYYGFYVTY